jgi:hypothetical protein
MDSLKVLDPEGPIREADIGTPRSGPFRGNGLPIMVKQPSYSTIHLSMAFLCSFSSYYPAESVPGTTEATRTRAAT